MTSHLYVDIARRMESRIHDALALGRSRRPYGTSELEEQTERWAGEQDGIRFARELVRVDRVRSLKAQLILLEVAAATRRMMVETRAQGILRCQRVLLIAAAYAEGYYAGIMGVIALAWPMIEEDNT